MKVFFLGLKYITSKFGNRMLVVANYTYSKDGQNSTKSKIRWICSKKTIQRCNAFIITIDDYVVKMGNIHTHLPL